GDTSARNVTITANQIIGLTVPDAPINVSAATVSTLNIAGPFIGGSIFTIKGPPAAAVLQVVAPGPGDIVNVQAAAAGTINAPTPTGIASSRVNVGQQGSLQAIQGTVEILNAVFRNFFPTQGIPLADVQIDGSADPAPLNATMTIVPSPFFNLPEGKITGLA